MTNQHRLIVAALLAATATFGFAAAVGALSLEAPNHAPMPVSDEDPDQEASFPDPVVLEKNRLNRSDGSGTWATSFLYLDVEGYEAEHAGEPEPASVGPTPSQEELGDAEYGLRFEVEGQRPDGLSFPDEPVVLLDPYDNIWIHWSDGDSYGESIDISVTATWVDEYGREGPTSDPIHVTDDGYSSIPGCSSAGETTSMISVVAALLLLVGWMARGRSSAMG